MSHFGRSGPPDISDTYSLLILNISFRTTADDLFPLFDKYGKVVDISFLKTEGMFTGCGACIVLLPARQLPVFRRYICNAQEHQLYL
ncbi:serine/arginine-rich splicing factor SC35-like protein isoform X1 [Tanacetum coccineum]